MGGMCRNKKKDFFCKKPKKPEDGVGLLVKRICGASITVIYLGRQPMERSLFHKHLSLKT